MVRTQQTAEPFCTRWGIQPEQCSALAEFSVIDPVLIDGLSGEERKPFVSAYWNAQDPKLRQGPMADTFHEFNERVGEFIRLMPDLPDRTVVFGHGIWFGLLHWRLLGYGADSASDMTRFRRFQQGLPMPNCATFLLKNNGGAHWCITADEAINKAIAAIPRI